ncbi:MAG: TlpA disulfide reductase family protein [Gallionellaceae bacterium]|nr:TlpA disulfide reductase family protein [Gallionellaceae bacterium]
MLTSPHRRRLLQLALVGAATSFLPSCRDNADSIETIRGHFLQDISQLPNLDGNVTPFSVYSGVALVVNIWASWCPPCVQEMPSLEKLSTLFNPKDLRVIGISVDSDLNLVREFLIRVPLTFPMLWDRGNNILHIPSFPSTFLLRRDHSIARTIVGERNWSDPKMIEEAEQLLQVQRLPGNNNQ